MSTDPDCERIHALSETLRTQMEHRSIRAFTDEPIGEDNFSALMEIATRADTWAFYQQRTIIRVTDTKIRDAIAEISSQPYVGGSRGELLIFVVDLHRNARIREEAGIDIEPLQRINLFMAAAADTLISAQNVAVAGESIGLGHVYLGSINADPRRVIDLLHLPRMTYPLFGMLIGHPDQEPAFKPRLPVSIIAAENTYPEFDSLADDYAAYDDIVKTYYDLRDTTKPVGPYTDQIRVKLGGGKAESSPMLDILHEQGLALH